jgi:hypothetical protein
VTLEVLEPHGRQRAQEPREILRPDRHLCGIHDCAPREPQQRPAQKSKPGKRLKPPVGISPKSNITCADESCGKLVAKPLARIFVAAKM